MSRSLYHSLFAVFGLFCAVTLSANAADYGLTKGTPTLKQAGPLAFGPDGILFVGDTLSAAVYAIDTGDHAGAAGQAEVNIAGVNAKIADMIGSTVDNTVINDMVVNPASGNIYLSVSRGRGPDAQPVLFRANQKGDIDEVSLKDVGFAVAKFDNAPKFDEGARRNPRLSAITDLQFNSGKLIVAGLSNEEFASKLRVLNFPFDGKEADTSIEVYHGAHGRLETQSPVRTFITYENQVLAAYTCTPLVTIPVDDLKGEKIMGKTIAELGNRNNPLDMIVYRKGQQDYLLMSNDSRGVMKMKLSKPDIDTADAISSRINGTAGLTYETMEQFQNVVQLDKLDSDHAIMLVANSDNSLDLKTVALP
ncbi:MAG: hypothetical protein KDB22_06575 [Planctomycetales bacterium]|nr:hypothetical protein [Planctomycetales bacterium]